MKTKSQPQFPKKCTCCGGTIPDRKAWDALPPARGGLHASGLEWRNHHCDGTLCIEVEVHDDRRP